MVFVLENLATGGAQDAQGARGDITAFLNVAEEVEFSVPAGALYHKVPIKDFVPIPSGQMKESIAWIERHIGTRKVLVSCSAGIGRSSSVVIGYLCVALGFGFGQAVEFLARKKPDISILPRLIETMESIVRVRGKGV